MKKTLLIWAVIGFIVGLIFGISALAYGLGGLLETWPGSGWSWVSNLVILVLVFVMIIATVLTLAERKWSAMIQDRVGPNRARFPLLQNRPLGGLPHIISDALKMLTKEDFRPGRADALLFNLGPILAFAPVLALFAVVPAGPRVMVMGHTVGLQVANPDFGLLWVFAIASLAVYGTSLAGWSSNNKFALLGGVRAASQMISYEVALGLGLVGMMLVFTTVRLPEIIGAIAPNGLGTAQAQYLWGTKLGDLDLGIPAWGIFLQPAGFVCFFAAAFAETKRAPFDVPEGESEIIGYFVEYSGMKFGMFMISEFAEVVILSAITTAIFLGGWHIGFAGDAALASSRFLRENGWLLGAIYATIFWVKVLVLCYIQLAIRWTFPRFRYDQIQSLGWKILLPVGLANVFLTAALVLLDPSLKALAIVGFIEIAFVLALTLRRREQPVPTAEHPHAELPGAEAATHH
jgi:NADH-quinone oxidoreductase subunit H